MKRTFRSLIFLLSLTILLLLPWLAPAQTAPMPLLVVTVQVSPKSIALDKGETVTATCNVTGGVPPYTYNFNKFAVLDGEDIVFDGGTAEEPPSITFQPRFGTEGYVTVTVKDSSGDWGRATSDRYTITDDPAVRPLRLSAELEKETVDIAAGESNTVTCTVTGGEAPYTYKYYWSIYTDYDTRASDHIDSGNKSTLIPHYGNYADVYIKVYDVKGRESFFTTPLFKITGDPNAAERLSRVMDENLFPAHYPNVLNLPSDEIDSMIIGSFNPTLDKLERLLWICLKINDKKTLLLASYNKIFYDSTEGPLIQGVNNDSSEINEKYFLDKKQTLEDMSRYLSLTKFADYILVNGYKIVDFFRSENLIGIYNHKKFYHNRNFFDNKEEIELVFFTHDINELANLISIDLSKYDLPERIKKNMEDGSTKISAKDVYDLYMTIVPDEYLPTLTQRKFNINPTVPIFKDEILEKNINERAEGLGYFILPTKYGETKFLFYYLDFKTLYYYDFYTGEKIAKYGDTDFNKEYLNKLDVSDDFYIEDSNGVFNYLKRISNDFAFFVDEYLPGLDYLFTLSFTYGDFVDFYQKIPLDQQIDYSFYDFSKSPIIDQYDPAWFADRPAFVPTPVPTPSPVPTPTPTPPPYQELTLGSRGQAVLDMKGRFYELGYFRTTEFSDQFNKNTADTVKLFEKNNGLPVDGVADPVMLALLFSDSAVGK